MTIPAIASMMLRLRICSNALKLTSVSYAIGSEQTGIRLGLSTATHSYHSLPCSLHEVHRSEISLHRGYCHLWITTRTKRRWQRTTPSPLCAQRLLGVPPS